MTSDLHGIGLAGMARLTEFCEEQLEAKPGFASSVSGASTRSVEDLTKRYKKEFMKLSTGKGCCQRCGAVTKNIVHYKSR